jgi:hypothetical protein
LAGKSVPQAVDCDLCRQVTARVATHAVGNREQHAAGSLQYQAAVLVAGTVSQPIRESR